MQEKVKSGKFNLTILVICHHGCMKEDIIEMIFLLIWAWRKRGKSGPCLTPMPNWGVQLGVCLP